MYGATTGLAALSAMQPVRGASSQLSDVMMLIASPGSKTPLPFRSMSSGPGKFSKG
jgi:hypothetical protein